MKKPLFSLLFATVSLFTCAAIHTVSKEAVIPAQFTSIQAAVNASEHGDTIYIYGAGTMYSENVVLTKKLSLIGSGFNPDREDRMPTRIMNIVFTRGASENENSSGSVISGVEATDMTITRASQNVPIPSGFLIERCKINTLQRLCGSSILIRHNIITSLIFGGNPGLGTDITISNNIIENISSINSGASLITNNIIGTCSATLKNAVWQNNIFLGDYFYSTTSIFHSDRSGYSFEVSGNAFSNNLTASGNLFESAYQEYYTPVDALANVYYNSGYQGINTGTGNLHATAPRFEYIALSKSIDFQFNDFRLKNDSPGKNAGTDGTDIGIYGGNNPWPDGGAPGSGFQLSPMPAIPHIISSKLLNPVVRQGEDLHLEIKIKIEN